jgi:hypothetical protein
MERIKLQYPLDGVEEVELRRPKVRDLRKMDKVKGDLAKSVALIADLTELSPDQVEELDAADFTAISDIVAGWVGSVAPRD